jgi:hypothetical protein
MNYLDVTRQGSTRAIVQVRTDRTSNHCYNALANLGVAWCTFACQVRGSAMIPIRQ